MTTRMITRLSLAWKAATGLFGPETASQAMGLLSGVLPGGSGPPPTRGTAEYLKAYSQMPWLRAVTSRVASSVAKADWQAFVVRENGKATRQWAIQRGLSSAHRREMMKALADAGTLEQIVDHPLLTLLHFGNSMLPGLVVRKVTQAHLDLVGEGFWLKERDALGVPIGVWPLPPDWILGTPTPAAPVYRVQFRAWAGTIPDTEVLWFCDADPANPYGRGSGTAQALGDELETDEYAAKHVKAFFFNRARPDLIVYPKAPQTLNEASVARMEEDWLSRSSGFWRAFKPYFLGREVGIHELSQDFQSQQFVQLREYERASIIQVYGLPPEILGILESSNRATIESADYLMSRYVVEPRLEFMRAVLQERLVPEFDERLLLDFVSPVQEDKQFKLEAVKAAPYVLTVDELRGVQGYQPKQDGQGGTMHMVPINVMPMEMGESLGVMPGEPDMGPPSVPVTDAAWTRDADLDVRALLDGGSDDDARLVLRMAFDGSDDLPRASAVAARQERAFVRSLVRAWQAGEAQVHGDALDQACVRHDEDAIVSALRVDHAAQHEREAVLPLLTSAFMRGVQVGAEPLRAMGVAVREAQDEIQKDDALVLDLAALHPEAEAWARAHAAELLVAAPAVRARVRILIERAIREGIAPRDLARLIKHIVLALTEGQMVAVANFRERLTREGLSPEKVEARTMRYADAQLRLRSRNIARTELIGATNGGQQALWMRAIRARLISPTRARKSWLVAPDDRLCDRCERLGSLDPVAVDQTFDNGKMNPPDHPSCRCAMGLVRA